MERVLFFTLSLDEIWLGNMGFMSFVDPPDKPGDDSVSAGERLYERDGGAVFWLTGQVEVTAYVGVVVG